MSKLKLAVIGAGHLGKIHTRLASRHPHAELVAVADPSLDALSATADLLREEGCQREIEFHRDYRQLIGNVDAAVVAAPTRLHESIGHDLIEHGIHLLMEKPLAPSATQAAGLVDAAASRGVVLQVGHVERFNPAFRSVAQEGGRAYYIEAVRQGPFTFRSTDVGVVMDLMIHDIDLALHLAQAPVRDVRAIGISVFGADEDMAQARIEFENGCVANLTASRASFSPRRSLQWFGDRGYCSVDLGDAKAMTVQPDQVLAERTLDVLGMSNEERGEFREELFTRWLPCHESKVEPANAILDEQADFIEAIENDREPAVTGEDGQAAVEVAARVLDSLREHAWGSSPLAPRGPLIDQPQLLAASESRLWPHPTRRAG